MPCLARAALFSPAHLARPGWVGLDLPRALHLPTARGQQQIVVDGPDNTPPLWIDTADDPRVLEVTVPQATVARCRLSSTLTESDLGTMALWQLITSANDRGRLHGLARSGQHWMLTPPEDMLT